MSCTTGPDFEDVDRGDTVTAALPPRCHGATMRDLSEDTDPETRAAMDAGLHGRWQCWDCECEIYTDANGAVTERPYDACDDHCTCHR
ncbi:hypothetical protein [Streptomyces sp. SID3343]|uniref:hypothetical protein n=1 Tax=Streptomyces sp. SID3343 TaxID=2690260 RepID=UPI00136C7FBE|nr:hypothetical protein [Streptomyces sp. SID3343]MYW01112.1 hypothetical protein [Streptomyces sp. SID3343]